MAGGSAARRQAPSRADQLALAGLAVLTGLRLVVAACTPLSPDEAYYWVWSRTLAPGYLDHPPMVALWIRAGTLLAGHGALGVRLLAPVAAALGSLLLWQAARDLHADPAAARRAVLVLNATLLFGVGAVTMTPDTPLLFFWTAALAATARLLATGHRRWWLGVGVACGLAMVSKYTALLLPIGLATWLIWSRQWRSLRDPIAWAAAVLAGTLFLPTLLWNAHHDWVSFAKQGGRSFVFDPSRAAAHVSELAAGQIALATPILFMLLALGTVAATREAWRCRTPASTVLPAFILPAVAVFIEHALGDRVQANWPAIAYPAAAIAAGPVAGRLFWPGVGLGFGLTAVVVLQGAAAVLPLPVALDPTLRLSGGYAALARDVRHQAAANGARFIAVDDYGPAALLALLDPCPGPDGVPCMPIIGLEPRWALFGLQDARPSLGGQMGLLLRSSHRHSAPDLADWSSLTPAGTLVRSRHGRPAETYQLYSGRLRTGTTAAVLLPRPPPG